MSFIMLILSFLTALLFVAASALAFIFRDYGYGILFFIMGLGFGVVAGLAWGTTAISQQEAKRNLSYYACHGGEDCFFETEATLYACVRVGDEYECTEIMSRRK